MSESVGRGWCWTDCRLHNSLPFLARERIAASIEGVARNAGRPALALIPKISSPSGGGSYFTLWESCLSVCLPFVTCGCGSEKEGCSGWGRGRQREKGKIKKIGVMSAHDDSAFFWVCKNELHRRLESMEIRSLELFALYKWKNRGEENRSETQHARNRSSVCPTSKAERCGLQGSLFQTQIKNAARALGNTSLHRVKGLVRAEHKLHFS